MISKYKKIKVDNSELRALINCMNEMRNKMISEDKDTNYINELLMKYITIFEK